MKKRLFSLPFKLKLLLSIVAITSVTLFFIVYATYQYQANHNMQQALSQAEHSVVISAESLSGELFSLFIASSKMILQEPYSTIITDLSSGKGGSYTKNLDSVNATLSVLLSGHRILSDGFLYARTGQFFSVSRAGLGKDREGMFPEDIWSITECTVLPIRHNEIKQIGDTIPLVLPLSRSGEYIYYQDTSALNLIRFALLLDAKHIREGFGRYDNSYTYIQYLANQDGLPLDITVENASAAFSPMIMDQVKEAGDTAAQAVSLDGEVYYVTVQPLGFFGLKAAHLTRRSDVLSDMRILQAFFTVIFLVGTLCAGLMCLLLSGFLLRPLKRVTRIIQCINDQSYNEKLNFLYRDEIGILGNQINTMYDTIQTQIEKITQDEREKTHSEIQMLSEQINPHFLYNTLERIHMRMLSGHGEAAAQMLEGLGKYLRLTLSFGSPTVLIEKEIAHVAQYVALMDHYLENGLKFSTKVEPGLESVPVPKNLLQPLVENSIKYGFEKEWVFDMMVMPEIEVAVFTQNNALCFTVTDNGRGFDPAMMEGYLCNQSNDGRPHFGLNNLQKRLAGFYSKAVTISFESIPYFKNTIRVVIDRNQL